jgi:hypothetical protein
LALEDQQTPIQRETLVAIHNLIPLLLTVAVVVVRPTLIQVLHQPVQIWGHKVVVVLKIVHERLAHVLME